MARRPVDVAALVDRVGEGDRRAIARAITLVENRDPAAAELVRAPAAPRSPASRGLPGLASRA
jgi:putative protein kinase ArgK-like GTPase of G3E family